MGTCLCVHCVLGACVCHQGVAHKPEATAPSWGERTEMLLGSLQGWGATGCPDLGHLTVPSLGQCLGGRSGRSPVFTHCPLPERESWVDRNGSIDKWHQEGLLSGAVPGHQDSASPFLTSTFPHRLHSQAAFPLGVAPICPGLPYLPSFVT